MPNWCSNNIHITGDNAEIKSLLVQAGNEENEYSKFFLNNFIPMPEVEAENWYSWKLSNWGTKWDIGNVAIEINDKSASFICDTAWSPPLNAFNKISQQYPTLKFEIFYEEPGMDLCGKAIFENGILIENVSASYFENFGTRVNFETDKSNIENNQIVIPFSLTKKEDPYNFDYPHKTIKGIMKFDMEINPDNFEEAFNNYFFSFVLKEEDNIFFKRALQDSFYDIIQSVEEDFEKIKKSANYNYLKQSVCENGNNKKRKKI